MKIKAPSHGTVIAYLALFMAMGGTASAATGGTFILGKSNAASTQTLLTQSTATQPVLALSTKPGQVPLAVSAHSGKASNLNSDKLDGLDSTAFLRSGSAVNASTLSGLGASSFARSSDLAGLQQRVSGTCPAGQAMVGVNSSGTVSCTSPSAPPPAPAPAQFRDKGFAITDLQVSKDAVGDWDAVGRITNETSTVRTGTFTITVFRGGSIVATLRGSVSDLAPGSTNTVTFFSSDDFTDGEFTTTFQTDNVSEG